MDLERIVAELKAERDRIEKAIAVLEMSATSILGASKSGRTPARRKNRKRGGYRPKLGGHLSEVMKKRWAERKKNARKRSEGKRNPK